MFAKIGGVARHTGGAGRKNNRHAGKMLPDPPSKGEPAHARELNVAEDNIDVAAVENCLRLSGAADFYDLEAALPQVLGDRKAHQYVVLDDEDGRLLRTLIHFRWSSVHCVPQSVCSLLLQDMCESEFSTNGFPVTDIFFAPAGTSHYASVGSRWNSVAIATEDVVPISLFLVIGFGIAAVTEALRQSLQKLALAEAKTALMLRELTHRTRNELAMFASASTASA